MIKTYSQFITEQYIGINIPVKDRELFNEILQYVIESNIFTDSESKLLKESFYDSLKNRYDKAKEVATQFSDKAKDTLKKALDVAKSATDFISSIKNGLIKYIKNILSVTKDKISKKLQSDNKFTSKVKELAKSSGEELKKDLTTCKEIFSFYSSKLTNNLMNSVEKGMSEVLVGSKQPVVENLQILLEGNNNVIAKLFHGLESIPPFNWLHNVAHLGEKGANSILGALSQFTNKLGGPEFQLPVIATILGIAFEYNVKGLAKTGLIDLAAFFTIPFVAIIIKVIGWIATFMASVALIDTIGSFGILGHGGHDKHSDEPESSNEH